MSQVATGTEHGVGLCLLCLGCALFFLWAGMVYSVWAVAAGRTP